jgi:uncharacterized phage protein (TIGR01671 family)
MRQIKFRGLDKSGKWRHGYYFVETSETGHYIREVGFDGPTMDDPGSGDVYIEDHAVTKESIGQYIGLKDKNGVEIYDGDYIQFGNYLYEVVYSESHAAFMGRTSARLSGLGKWKGSVLNNPDDLYYLFTDKSYDKIVIGNIHENKDLVQ